MLVARYSQVVFRVAYRITGNESDAEEAVQETFLRGYQKLANFEGRSSMATWIYRIGANCALDIVSRRRPEHEPDSRRERSEQREVQLADIKAGPDRLLLSREIEASAASSDERTYADRADGLRSAAHGRPLYRRDRSCFEHRSQRCQTGGVSRGAEAQAPMAPLWVNT